VSTKLTTAPHLAAHPCVAASGRALTHIEVRSRASSAAPSAGLAMTMPITGATPLAGHSRVVGSARSLSHLQVRALTCSPTPWTDLARIAAARF
jgi:hypothetical protein